jgi:hypothetical protein
MHWRHSAPTGGWSVRVIAHDQSVKTGDGPEGGCRFLLRLASVRAGAATPRGGFRRFVANGIPSFV